MQAFQFLAQKPPHRIMDGQSLQLWQGFARGVEEQEALERVLAGHLADAGFPFADGCLGGRLLGDCPQQRDGLRGVQAAGRKGLSDDCQWRGDTFRSVHFICYYCKYSMTRASFQHALEEILDVPRASLKETDGRDTLPNWTSLADVQILTTIESEFGLEPDVGLLGAETIGDLMRVLDDRGVFT